MCLLYDSQTQELSIFVVSTFSSDVLLRAGCDPHNSTTIAFIKVFRNLCLVYSLPPPRSSLLHLTSDTGYSHWFSNHLTASSSSRLLSVPLLSSCLSSRLCLHSLPRYSLGRAFPYYLQIEDTHISIFNPVFSLSSELVYPRVFFTLSR